MVNKDYEMNMTAVEETISYLTSLRKQANLTLKNVSFYTDITSECIKIIEKRKVKNPRLKTLLYLAGFWQLSDDQIVAIYDSLCNKDKKLEIIDKNPIHVSRRIVLKETAFDNLSKNLKVIRKNEGLTLANVQEEIGVDSSTVSALERHRHINSLDLIISFCKLYNIKDDQVLSFYHQALPNIAIKKRKPFNLDDFSKNQLIEIILNQNLEPNKYYSSTNKIFKKKL